MPTLIAATALILGATGDIKYPAICIPRQLSHENNQTQINTEKDLSRRPDFKRGEETIAEVDRAGNTFRFFTCCNSL
jgi:hypothetical protein